MKIFFTASRYESVSLIEANYARASEILNCELTYMSVVGSVFQTFELLKSEAGNKAFVWIDSDNWLYPEAVTIFDHAAPIILHTKNEYGIVYGHGGIKYCDGRVSLPTDYQTIDCSKHARYRSIDTIGSYHHLGDGWRKIRTIWVEMCKLALRGSVGRYYLQQWIAARPDIWTTVDTFLRSSTSIQDVKRLLNNRVAFKEYYDTELCRYLQE